TALMGIRSGVCALILRTLVNLSRKNGVDRLTLAMFFIVFTIPVFTDLSPVVPVVAGAAIGIIAKKTGVAK
ncbi:MAG: chromate transporter, partial [Lachnospiraceae bacterium]|nr:chromate transporter [Lachnospiraceae bacterium]